jgi:hypothetical protein
VINQIAKGVNFLDTYFNWVLVGIDIEINENKNPNGREYINIIPKVSVMYSYYINERSKTEINKGTILKTKYSSFITTFKIRFKARYSTLSTF